MDGEILLPLGRIDDPLVADAGLDIAEPEELQAFQDQGAVGRPRGRPVDPGLQVRHRDQDVEGGVAGRRHAAIGVAGMLHVEGGLHRQRPLGDLPDVLLVAVGQEDRVVPEAVGHFPLDAEIEHEGRAGEPRLLDLGVAPARAVPLRHEGPHHLGEVAVDQHRVGVERLAVRHHAARRACRRTATRSTLVLSRRSTPMRPASPAIASETAPQPPTGW